MGEAILNRIDQAGAEGRGTASHFPEGHLDRLHASRCFRASPFEGFRAAQEAMVDQYRFGARPKTRLKALPNALSEA